MKRLMTIALVLLAGLTACAQGKWSVSHREADELKGQKAQDVYIYEAAGIGSLVVWDWKSPNFRLISEKGMFRKMVSGGNTFVPVKVGFYDESGKLEKSFTINLLEELNHSGRYIATADFYMLGRKDIKKTLARLKSGKGYVRMLAMLYNQPDFDLKVTPFQQ